MNADFENYLRDQHAMDYAGLDDEMGEAFEDWISDFGAEDWISYANLYTNHFIV